MSKQKLLKYQDSLYSGFIKAGETNRLEITTARSQSQIFHDFSIGYFSQSIRGTQDIKNIPGTFGPGERFSGIQAAKINHEKSLIEVENYSKSVSGNLRTQLDIKYSQILFIATTCR